MVRPHRGVLARMARQSLACLLASRPLLGQGLKAEIRQSPRAERRRVRVGRGHAQWRSERQTACLVVGASWRAPGPWKANVGASSQRRCVHVRTHGQAVACFATAAWTGRASKAAKAQSPRAARRRVRVDRGHAQWRSESLTAKAKLFHQRRVVVTTLSLFVGFLKELKTTRLLGDETRPPLTLLTRRPYSRRRPRERGSRIFSEEQSRRNKTLVASS